MTDTVVSWSTHRKDRRSWVWDAALTVPLDEPKPALFFSALTDETHTVRSVGVIVVEGDAALWRLLNRRWRWRLGRKRRRRSLR